MAKFSTKHVCENMLKMIWNKRIEMKRITVNVAKWNSRHLWHWSLWWEHFWNVMLQMRNIFSISLSICAAANVETFDQNNDRKIYSLKRTNRKKRAPKKERKFERFAVACNGYGAYLQTLLNEILYAHQSTFSIFSFLFFFHFIYCYRGTNTESWRSVVEER